MDRTDRIQRLGELLANRRMPLSMDVLCDELACSDRTVYRTIEVLRDRFGMPIEKADGRGYFLNASDPASPHRLPDLWFTSEELEALLILQRHLEGLEPGLLADRLEPARERIEKILSDKRPGIDGLAERVRFIAIGQRHTTPEQFATVAEALIQRKALQVHYHARSDDRVTERTIEPQRLVHYRDTWYLDAWCRERKALRTFSVDRLRRLEITRDAARDIPADALDRHFASSYGIFAGEPDHVAIVRFSPEGARWAAEVEWHPEQQGRWTNGDCYELRVPFSRPEELIRDILAYGPDAEVIAPDSLRQELSLRIAAMAAIYD